MEDKTYLPTNLKFLRISKGLTQKELANNLNKDYTSIGKWELGTRSPIMIDIIKISEYFNVPLNDLIMKDLRIKEKNITILPDDEVEQTIRQIKNMSDEAMKEEDKQSIINIINSLHERAKKEK